MHLVHIRLHAMHEQPLPADASARLLSCARPEDALEHVSVSHRPPGPPTLGLFFSSAALADAEIAALRVTLRALRSGGLDGFAVESCEAALIPPFRPWTAHPQG